MGRKTSLKPLHVSFHKHYYTLGAVSISFCSGGNDSHEPLFKALQLGGSSVTGRREERNSRVTEFGDREAGGGWEMRLGENSGSSRGKSRDGAFRAAPGNWSVQPVCAISAWWMCEVKITVVTREQAHNAHRDKPRRLISSPTLDFPHAARSTESSSLP